MFVSKKDRARAIYHMVRKSGTNAGYTDGKRGVYVLDGKAYAMNYSRRLALCMGCWFEFMKATRQPGSTFIPVFVRGVNCI